MYEKRLLPAVLVAALALTGCAPRPAGTGYPAPRALATEFEAYRAPEEPGEDGGAVGVEEPTGDLTLADVLGLALMGNPRLAGYSWAVRAAGARAYQAARIPNPEIEVEIEEFGGIGDRAGFVGAEAVLMLTQVLETGGKRGKRARVALLERDLGGWDYEAGRLDVVAEATSAFITVLANQERLALAEESHRISQIVLEVVTERVNAGKVSPLERTRAEVEAASVKIEAERARNDLEASRRALAATWGGENPVFGRVVGDLTRVEDVPPLGRLSGRAAHAPEVARWSTEMAMHEAAVEMEKSLGIPDLGVGVGVRRELQFDLDSYIIALGFAVPVFDRNQGGVREAEYNLARAAEERRAAETKVSAELAEAYRSLVTAYEEATSLATTVLPGARSAFEATSEGYRQGKFAYLEVLDSQRTLFDVRAQYLDALEAYHQSVTDLERIMGSRLNGGHMENNGGNR